MNKVLRLGLADRATILIDITSLLKLKQKALTFLLRLSVFLEFRELTDKPLSLGIADRTIIRLIEFSGLTDKPPSLDLADRTINCLACLFFQKIAKTDYYPNFQ